MRRRPHTLKLHVQRGDHWLPVFCYRDDGTVITCEREPGLALPSKARSGLEARWAKNDLAFFRRKFSNEVFELRHIDTSAIRAS